MAKPKIFISSTYYDLKYIREAIKNFIETFNYESILNEFGNITYTHDQELDKSCFNEVKNCDMLILIVGGRYGSQISEEERISDNKIEFYDNYTSITSQEFKTAHKENIPIYIFIEKSVHSEFYTYKKNSKNEKVIYAHADSINIYKFIDDLKNDFSNSIIFDFEKFEDIQNILKDQWAGLFHNYLKSLRSNKETDNKNSINKLELVTDNINIMINQLGKKLLDKDYTQIINDQNLKILEFYTSQAVDHLDLEFSEVVGIEDGIEVIKIIMEEFINKPPFNSPKFAKKPSEISEEDIKSLTDNMKEVTVPQINKRLKDLFDYSIKFNMSKSGLFGSDYYINILPIINETPQFREEFINFSANKIMNKSKDFLEKK